MAIRTELTKLIGKRYRSSWKEPSVIESSVDEEKKVRSFRAVEGKILTIVEFSERRPLPRPRFESIDKKRSRLIPPYRDSLPSLEDSREVPEVLLRKRNDARRSKTLF